MAKYRIDYSETCTGVFYVEAETEKDALEEFEYEAREGMIDYSRLEVESNGYTAELVKEEE